MEEEQKKDIRLNLALPESLMNELKEEASQDRMSISAVVRRRLRRGVLSEVKENPGSAGSDNPGSGNPGNPGTQIVIEKEKGGAGHGDVVGDLLDEVGELRKEVDKLREESLGIDEEQGEINMVFMKAIKDLQKGLVSLTEKIFGVKESSKEKKDKENPKGKKGEEESVYDDAPDGTPWYMK